MPPILRCRDLQPPALQDWNIKYRIQIYAGSQTASNNCNEMVQNRWLWDKHPHTQSHTIYHNIILGRHPVCETQEAPQLAQATEKVTCSTKRSTVQCPNSRKFSKNIFNPGHGSLMMQAIHSFLVCGQISWRYSHRPWVSLLCPFSAWQIQRPPQQPSIEPAKDWTTSDQELRICSLNFLNDDDSWPTQKKVCFVQCFLPTSSSGEGAGILVHHLGIPFLVAREAVKGSFINGVGATE